MATFPRLRALPPSRRRSRPPDGLGTADHRGARPRRWPRALAALVVLGATATALPADPASAGLGTGNPVLRVSSSTLPGDRGTTITVTGTDYLVPPHAPGASVFGGVYLFFGWVDSGKAWGPSARNSSNNDGTFGSTYAYPGDGGDAGTRDDGSGRMRLVSFTAGGESGLATDFHMDRAGNWSTTLVIPGSTFEITVPQTGETRRYDCRRVQCGVFTVGAHGKASATNEKFTPINFTAPATPPPTTAAPRPTPASPGPGATTPGGSGGTGAGGTGSGGTGAGGQPGGAADPTSPSGSGSSGAGLDGLVADLGGEGSTFEAAAVLDAGAEVDLATAGSGGAQGARGAGSDGGAALAPAVVSVRSTGSLPVLALAAAAVAIAAAVLGATGIRRSRARSSSATAPS